MSDFTLAASGLNQYDPISPLQKLANLGTTNLQNQGLDITNQSNQLGLLATQARTVPLLNAMGIRTPGMPAPTLGVLGAPSGTPGGSGGLAAMASPAAGGGQAPAAPMPGDISQQMYGVALPPLQALAAGASQNPAAAFAELAKTRTDLLHQTAASAYDQASWNQGVATLAQQGWLSSQSAAGLMNRFDLQPRILRSYADANSDLSATTAQLGMGMTTDAQGNPIVSAPAVAAKGAIAGAEATGRNQSDLVYKPQIDQAENGPLAARAGLTAKATLGTDVTKAQANPYNLAPGETRINPPVPGQGRSADLLGNGGTMSPADYANTVNGTENSTGNPAAKNPRSSATGNGQFVDSTWLPMMRATRPDLAGLTDQQLLTLRSSPGMAQQGTIALAQQNAPVLQQAGFNVNSATLGMAHRLGAGGAIAVLNAPPSTPLSSILPANVIAANPDLANQTAAGFVNASKAKYGVQPVALGGGAASTQRVAAPAPGASGPPAIPAAAGAAPAGYGQNGDAAFTPGASPGPVQTPPSPSPINGRAPSPNLPVPGGQPPSPWNTPTPQPPPVVTQLPGGGTAVQSGLTPAAVERQKNDVTQMSSYRQGLLTNAQAAVDQNAHIAQMTDQSDNFTMGWGADQKLQAKAVFDGIAKTFGIPESQSFSDSLGSQQAFLKNAGELARAAARQVGSRTGAQELGMIQSTLPSDTMSSQAFGRVMTQMGGLNDYAIAKSAAAASASGNPSQFEAVWNANVSPTPFIINRMSQQDAQTLATNLGKTAQGRAAWANIMAEMKFADQNGLFGMVH